MLTVYLVPTGNVLCDVFPNAVSFNLTLRTPVFNRSLTKVVGNFNYSTTTYVEFEASDPNLYNANMTLADFKEEVFAMLHLFTVAEINYLELSIFNDVKSDLSKCFTNLTAIINKIDIVL
jgi:hypothetical protein